MLVIDVKLTLTCVRIHLVKMAVPVKIMEIIIPVDVQLDMLTMTAHVMTTLTVVST